MDFLRYSVSTCSADDMQQKTRRRSKFPDVEASLLASTPSNFKTFRPVQPKRLVSDPVANILSYLGSRNPWPQPVTKDDELWLFDNTAFVTTKKEKDGKETHTLNAEFIAAVFSQHPSCTVSDVVVQIADKIGLADDDDAKETIEQRLRPFLMDIQPGKQVLALYGGETHLKFSSGSRSGISTDVKAIPAAPAGMVVPTTAQVPEGVTGLLQSKTFFADPEGWAVISGMYIRLFVFRWPATNFAQTLMTPSRSHRQATQSASSEAPLSTSRSLLLVCPSSTNSSSLRSLPHRHGSICPPPLTISIRSCASFVIPTILMVSYCFGMPPG